MSLTLLNLPAPPESGKKAFLGGPYNLGSIASLLVGVRSQSGQFVTPATALRASAVLACIRILCEDISALPLRLFRRTVTGAQPATDHPLYRLLHDSPNPFMTSMEMRESMILDCLSSGQSFVEKEISSNGISALWPLSAARMVFANPLEQFVEPNDPPLFYRYADPRSGQRTLLSDDLWITRVLSPAGTVEGQSIILLAREAIGLALAAQEQGARLFAHGIQSDTVITSPADVDVDDEQRKELRKSLQDRYSGSANAFLPLLLQGGLDIKRIGLTAQESQYLESRAFQLQDIARIFRIPDVLLGVQQGKTATFASAEQFFLSYVKYTLQPWCTRIEQAIHRDLLAPSEAAEYFVKHDLDSLTRADLQTRYSAHAAGIAAGFLTRNEARVQENLPTLPGLDEPLSPLNLGSGTNLKPAQGAGARAAQQLARNCVAHEEKLLADGKPAQDVYAKLLPAYLRDKAGLTIAQCVEYCSARLAGASDGVELLTQLLIAG